MAAGDREVLKALEEVTTRNVTAVVAHANETREITLGVEKRINKLEEIILQQNEIIEAFRLQLSLIQGKLYSGGT